MCASWPARYGENPNARPAQIPANTEPVSRRPEKVREEPRQRERQQEADVVGRDRIEARPLQRRRHDAQPNQMLRERHRAGHWPHHRCVPPRLGERRGLGIPPEDPDVEDRISRVVGNARRQRRCGRPRPEDGERAESEEDPERLSGSRLWAYARSSSARSTRCLSLGP